MNSIENDLAGTSESSTSIGTSGMGTSGISRANVSREMDGSLTSSHGTGSIGPGSTESPGIGGTSLGAGSEKYIKQAIQSRTEGMRVRGAAKTQESGLKESYKLGKVFYDKADLIAAEDHFLRAMEQCELPQDGYLMMKIAGFLIRIYSESLRKDDADTYIDISKMILDLIFASSDDIKAEYFYYLGVTNTYSGKFEEAKKNFAHAHRKAQEENEPELVAKALFSLAQSHYNLREFEETNRLLKQLEQLLSILNKEYLKGSMYLLQGNVCGQTGEYEKSLKSYRMATKELNNKLCWNLFGYLMLAKGISHKKMGDYKMALVHFETAQDFTNRRYFKRLSDKLFSEIEDVNDSTVDFYIDRHNRIIKEKEIGIIDFKHRFVLLEILFLLAKNPGNYFDKEDLSREIWKEEYNPLIHDKLIYTSISRLRKLIEPQDVKNKYIVRGKDGYTFSPRVKVRFYQDAQFDNNSIGNVEISSPI